MDVRQLRAIVAVVDHGGVSRAAETLHVAQPSLSQTIRSFENELGVELFARVGRRLILTAAGEALLGPARQVLRDMETVGASVADVKGLAAGHLDLVAEPTLATDPVAALIGAFRVAHPGVTVRLAEPDNAAELVSRVTDGRSEVGLAELPLAVPDRDAEGLVHLPLLIQDVLLVRPPGTRPTPMGLPRTEQARAPDRVIGFPVERLAGAPLITTPLGTSSRALLERAMAAAAVSPVVAVETEQRDALLPLVLAGAGSALLPGPLAEQARRRGAVVCELVPPLRRTVGLVHRAGMLSPAARAFVALAGAAQLGSDPTIETSSSSSGSGSNASSSNASQSTGDMSTSHSPS